MLDPCYHLQISGGIGDGSYTASQYCRDDATAIQEAESKLARCRIANAATRATLWRGEFGPTAVCVACWDIVPTVLLDRNSRREMQQKIERTPR